MIDVVAYEHKGSLLLLWLQFLVVRLEDGRDTVVVVDLVLGGKRIPVAWRSRRGNQVAVACYGGLGIHHDGLDFLRVGDVIAHGDILTADYLDRSVEHHGVPSSHD